jgi:hypothetical protein
MDTNQHESGNEQEGASRCADTAGHDTAGQSSVRSAMFIVSAACKEQAPLGAAWRLGRSRTDDMPLLTELNKTTFGARLYRRGAPNGAEPRGNEAKPYGLGKDTAATFVSVRAHSYCYPCKPSQLPEISIARRGIQLLPFAIGYWPSGIGYHRCRCAALGPFVVLRGP